jgi:hypothetical protein
MSNNTATVLLKKFEKLSFEEQCKFIIQLNAQKHTMNDFLKLYASIENQLEPRFDEINNSLTCFLSIDLIKLVIRYCLPIIYHIDRSYSEQFSNYKLDLVNTNTSISIHYDFDFEMENSSGLKYFPHIEKERFVSLVYTTQNKSGSFTKWQDRAMEHEIENRSYTENISDIFSNAKFHQLKTKYSLSNNEFVLCNVEKS